jgi:hypothetical protein
MLDSEKTVGEIIRELYKLWDVQFTNWPNDSNPSHLEFELRGFNPKSEEQIKLVSELCYIVKSGASYNALKKMLPDQEFESVTLEEIKDYFSGKDYSSDKKTYDEFIKNQRNPFILELMSTVFRYAHDATIEEVKGMFSVNVVGLIACTSMVLPLMKKQSSGHIINIASMAGKIATPKSSAYSATRHAVLGYSNSLRMELADDNVYVTTVNPGPIATNFFDIADEQGTYVKNVQRYMLQPDFVAQKITDAMFTKKREINLPRWMNAGSILFALFPNLFERAGKKAFNKK